MKAVTPAAVPKEEQQSVIQILTIKNVSGSEICTRMCVVYGVQNVIRKSTINQWVQRFKIGQTSTSNEPRSNIQLKKKTQCGMQQASSNTLINTKNAALHMAIMSKSRL